MQLNWSFIAERDLSSLEDAEIRRLLVAAYPQYVDIFTNCSYYGTPPQYRLLGREPNSDSLVAHLECGTREIWSSGMPVNILGIGAVAVHPVEQGLGRGKEMFVALRTEAFEAKIADYGFLECREAVAPFYLRVGFHRVPQSCTSIDPDTGRWDTYRGPVMVLPLLKPMDAWPIGGDVHLLGMPW